jgi:hypothetical protein
MEIALGLTIAAFFFTLIFVLGNVKDKVEEPYSQGLLIFLFFLLMFLLIGIV